ncbi:hypothetical protein [Haladaptatus halobius]|uniref:hypothetical protein n=1 Tax=Haladaptatus halobius TaxID=2884875 RepID=UPI001D0AEB0C|nr:hypothetical protein [Haladaptatus halobius]
MSYLRRAGTYTTQAFLFNLVSAPLVLAAFGGSDGSPFLGLLVSLLTVCERAHPVLQRGNLREGHIG